MSNQERKEKLKNSLNNEIFQKVEELETKTDDKYDELMTDKLSKILPKKEETEPSADTVEIIVEEEVEIEVNDDSLLRDYDNFINESAKTLNDIDVSKIEESQKLEDITTNVADDTIVDVKQNNKPEKVVDENTADNEIDLEIEESTTIDLGPTNEEIAEIKEDIKKEKRVEKQLKKEKKKELKKAQKENQKSGSVVIDVLLVLAIVLLIALIMYLR